MFRKISLLAFFLIILSAEAAGPGSTVKDYLRKTYYRNRKVSLVVDADSTVPFAQAKIFRVRDFTGQRGWIVLSPETGIPTEANTTSLEKFLRSIERGLVKMKFQKKDSDEAVRISNSLMNFLGPAKRTVACVPEKDRTYCELSFSEGPLTGEKANLLYDFKDGFILVRKKVQ